MSDEVIATGPGGFWQDIDLESLLAGVKPCGGPTEFHDFDHDPRIDSSNTASTRGRGSMAPIHPMRDTGSASDAGLVAMN